MKGFRTWVIMMTLASVLPWIASAVVASVGIANGYPAMWLILLIPAVFSRVRFITELPTEKEKDEHDDTVL